MDKSPESINLLTKEKILKEIDAGVNNSIIMALYKFKSSANVWMITCILNILRKKKLKYIEYIENIFTIFWHLLNVNWQYFEILWISWPQFT